MSSILPGLLCPRSYLDYYGLDPTCIIMSPILPGLLCPRSTWISMSSIYLDYYVLDLTRLLCLRSTCIITSSILPQLLCPRSYLKCYVLDQKLQLVFLASRNNDKNDNNHHYHHRQHDLSSKKIFLASLFLCKQEVSLDRSFMPEKLQKNAHSCIKQTTRNNRPTYQTVSIYRLRQNHSGCDFVPLGIVPLLLPTPSLLGTVIPVDLLPREVGAKQV